MSSNESTRGHIRLDNTDERQPDSMDIDPAVVQAERRRRISKAQDEELRWTDLTALLLGETDSLSYQRTRRASKLAENFVLSEDGLLHYQGQRRSQNDKEADNFKLRLVVPHHDD